MKTMGQRLRPLAWLMLAGLAVSGCDIASKKETLPPVVEKTARIKLQKVSFADLPGWQEGRQDKSWQALSRSCEKIRKRAPQAAIGIREIPMTVADWLGPCREILQIGNPDVAQARSVLSRQFSVYKVSDGQGDHQGLFTGYFEAELHGAKTADNLYKYPIYGKPSDLVTVDLGGFSSDLKGRKLVGMVKDGKLQPYPTRGVLEAGYLNGKAPAIAYADDPVDVFLLQVQGSGRIKLTDGTVLRIGFASHNGRGYKSIGKYLIEQGELEPYEASWDGIRRWIQENPDRQKELFAINPRFIFFREIMGDGPVGSQGVALTPGRSLAVDPSYIPLGAPIWLDSFWPSQHDKPLRRLMVAQDTGNAIKGVVRGDFFWGYGDEALKFAGRMKSPGSYYLLLPKSLDQNLAQTSD